MSDNKPPLTDRQAAWIANYISRCDDALQHELERNSGQWPDCITVPVPYFKERDALPHWLAELRQKSGKDIRLYFEQPKPKTHGFIDLDESRTKLTAAQQSDAIIRHVVKGEKIRAIARSYNVSATTIARLFKE